MNSQRQGDKGRRKAALVTAALFAVAVAAASLDRTDPGTARVPIVGEFTGEITPEGPVYRLPPMHVVADRKTEFARIEREERVARASEARAKTARKPDV